MFYRRIDIYASRESGETIKLIDSNQGVNNLICNGKIDKFSGTEVNQMTLDIFNLPPNIRGEIATKGGYNRIRVDFGYEDIGNMSTIFEGTLQKLVVKRDEAHTTKTTLYVWDSGIFKNYGYFSGSFQDGVNYYDIAHYVAKNGDVKISTDLSEELKKFRVKGSRTFEGTQDEVFETIANETGLDYKLSNNVASITSTSSGKMTVFSKMLEDGTIVSDSGLIGFPRLLDDGIEIECLINPNIEIFSLVMLNNSIVSVEQDGVFADRTPGAAFHKLYNDNDLGVYKVFKMSIEFSNDDGDCKMTLRTLSFDMLNEWKTTSNYQITMGEQ